MLTPEDLLAWGYVGIIVFLILTGCGLPIPEEVPIVAAGWAAAQGNLDPWLALGSCFIGAVVGDVIMYGIGRRFGRRLLQKRAWFASMLTPEKEHKIEEMFRHHGLKVLFVSRFLVGVRSPIYITAGILKVPFKRFVLVDTFCAAVMITVFYGLAYKYSESIARWIRQAELAVTITIGVLAIIALVGYRYYRKRKAAERLKDEQGNNKKGAASDDTETEVERSVA
jgi:membrane protein DedA with SNARE-associated domain